MSVLPLEEGQRREKWIKGKRPGIGVHTQVLGDSRSPHHLHGSSGGTGSGRLVWLDRPAT